jgi:Raf kinase inhibitor-like YbhB/YbcL family protein
MTFRLESSAFSDQHSIPTRYTCSGEDRSPPFTWAGAPQGTESFALICSDPDAPGGIFYHWGVYNIPADGTNIADGFGNGSRLGQIRTVINDFGSTGYRGPCPPKGHGVYHYHFSLRALSIGALPISGKADCRQLLAALKGHVLGTAQAIGTFGR